MIRFNTKAVHSTGDRGASMIGAPNCSPDELSVADFMIVLLTAADCACKAGGPTNGLESSAALW